VIGAVISVGVSCSLLGRHVSWGAECYSSGGELMFTCGFANGIGNSEVHHQPVLGDTHY
jgi:hypothetical protein